MQKIVFVVPLVMLTSALAGCVMEPADTTASETTASSDLANLGEPPTADLTVMIEGNLSMPDANGTIPAKVGVNVTFDASASNGTNVTFAWDFGDGTTMGTIPEEKPQPTNGSASNTTTASPTDPPEDSLAQPTQSPNATSGRDNGTEGAIAVHAYAEVGNFTVTVYVTDVESRTDVAMVDVTVSKAGPAPGTILRTESRQFKDSKTCSATDGVVSPAKTSTFEWVFYANETDGTPSEVVNVTIKGGPTDTKFHDPSGKELGKGASIEAKGPFPAGKYKITATSNCAAGSTTARTHNLDAFATYAAT